MSVLGRLLAGVRGTGGRRRGDDRRAGGSGAASESSAAGDRHSADSPGSGRSGGRSGRDTLTTRRSVLRAGGTAALIGTAGLATPVAAGAARSPGVSPTGATGGIGTAGGGTGAATGGFGAGGYGADGYGAGSTSGSQPAAQRFDTNGRAGLQFEEVLDAIEAYNTGGQVGGQPVSFGDVMDVFAAFDAVE